VARGTIKGKWKMTGKRYAKGVNESKRICEKYICKYHQIMEGEKKNSEGGRKRVCMIK
jgi:hypothetical protein